jgi:hypothetical protein
MVPEMEILASQLKKVRTIIVVNQGIIGPGFQKNRKRPTFKEVANGLRYYTLGKGAFVTVSDVLRMSVELMKSSTPATNALSLV